MAWNCLNSDIAERKFTHFVFVSDGDIAIADHSMKNTRDPASAEDGLLLVRGRPYLYRENYTHIDCYVLPLYSAKTGEEYSTITSAVVADLVNRLLDFRDDDANLASFQ